MISRLIFEMVGWAGFLVSAAGALVSALSLRRSRWALLLLLGFGGEAAVYLLYRLQALTGHYGSPGWESVRLFSSALGVAARTAVVVGAGGLLLERRGDSRGV